MNVSFTSSELKLHLHKSVSFSLKKFQFYKLHKVNFQPFVLLSANADQLPSVCFDFVFGVNLLESQFHSVSGEVLDLSHNHRRHCSLSLSQTNYAVLLNSSITDLPRVDSLHGQTLLICYPALLE